MNAYIRTMFHKTGPAGKTSPCPGKPEDMFFAGKMAIVSLMTLLVVVFFQGQSFGEDAGRALFLDGVDDYVDISSSFAGANGNRGTIMMWFMPGNLLAHTNPSCEPGDTTQPCPSDPALQTVLFCIRDTLGITYDANYGILRARAGTKEVSVIKEFSPGNWYHIALTYQTGQNLVLFVNGRKRASAEMQTEPLDFSAPDASIGRCYDGQTSFGHFPGKIEEFVMAQQALSAETIQRYMHKTLHSEDLLFSRLFMYLDFNEMITDTFPDATSYRNDARLVNADMAVSWTDSDAPVGDTVRTGFGQDEIRGDVWIPVSVNWIEDPGQEAVFALIELDTPPGTTAGLPAEYPEKYWKLWIADHNGYTADVRIRYDTIGGIHSENDLQLYHKGYGEPAWTPLQSVSETGDMEDDGIGEIGFEAGQNQGFGHVILGTNSPGNDFVKKIFYVRPDGSDTDAGLSWETAFATISKALSAASPGDSIWVMTGTYPESLNLKTGVSLLGGFLGNETAAEPRDPSVHSSVIDARNLGTSAVVGADNAGLDGFVILGGNSSTGGGLFLPFATMDIQQTVFEENTSSGTGGGVFIEGGNSRFKNCIFRLNTAAEGGAVYIRQGFCEFINCIFADNSSANGGGVKTDSYANPVFTNCTFANNSAGYGGAIFNADTAYTRVRNTILWGNTASEEGHEIHNENSNFSGLSIAFSLIRGWAAGNAVTGYPAQDAVAVLDQDPLFADPARDFHLKAGSPCIDAGSMIYAPEKDFEGDIRTDDPDTPNTGQGISGEPGYADIGADEYLKLPEPGTYYVDVANGDDSNPGSAAGPFKTLHKAINFINSGKPGSYTLQVESGTYSTGGAGVPFMEDPSPLIITRDNLTIIGDAGTLPVIDGLNGLGWKCGMEIRASGVTINQLEFKGFSDIQDDKSCGVMVSSGAGNTIENCRFHDNTNGIVLFAPSESARITGSEMFNNARSGILISGSGKNEIISNPNSIFDNGTAGDPGSGILVVNGAGENHISRNSIYYSGASGHPQAHGIRFADAGEQNRVTENLIFGHVGTDYAGIAVKNSDPLILENEIYNNHSGVWAEVDNNEDKTLKIWNNLVAENSGSGMKHGIRLSGVNGTLHSEVYHNTIYAAGIAGIRISGSANAEIRYNIVSESAVGMENSGATANVMYNNVYSSNDTHISYSGFIQGDMTGTNGNISLNPVFSGPGDFHPAKGPDPGPSPCIDVIPASHANPVSTDIEGKTRPLGQGYDMGCYETELPGATLIYQDTTLEDGVFNYANLIIAPGATLQTKGEVTLETDRLMLHSGASISGTGTGELAGEGPGAGVDASGGTYGGKGGNPDPTRDLPPPYGSAFSPNAPGSGGGLVNGQAGAGGGLLRIIAKEADIFGKIAVDGEEPAAEGGGGAGGGIFLHADRLAGTGTIQADGGGAGPDAGAGGGGRVCVYSGENTFSGPIMASGGAHAAYPGENGTAYKTDLSSLSALVPPEDSNWSVQPHHIRLFSLDLSGVSSGELVSVSITPLADARWNVAVARGAVTDDDFVISEKEGKMAEGPFIWTGKAPFTGNYYLGVGAISQTAGDIPFQVSLRLVPPLGPGEYYVDPVSGKNDQAGSQAAPWKDLSYAIDRINTGTAGIYVLHLAPGIYDVTSPGTDAGLTILQPDFTLAGASSDTTIIDGKNQQSTGIKVLGKNVTIKEIGVTGCTTGIQVMEEGCTIDRTRVFSNLETGILTDGSVNRLFVTRSRVHHNKVTGILAQGGEEHQITGSVFYDNGNGEQNSHGTGIIFRDTKSPLFRENLVYFSGEMDSVQDKGVVLKNTTGTGRVESNEFKGAPGADITGIEIWNCDALVAKNHFSDHLYTGVYLYGDTGDHSARIVNNLFAGTDSIHGLVAETGTDFGVSAEIFHNTFDAHMENAIHLSGETGPCNISLLYNIITRSGGCALDNSFSNPGTITSNRNVFFMNDSGNICGGQAGDNDMETDPEFYFNSGRPEYGNYYISAASEVVDAIPAGHPDPVTDDYAGKQRPIGAGFDPGFCEVVLGVPDMAEVRTVVIPEEGGSISGEGFECPGTCIKEVEKGTSIILSAVSNPGFVFDSFQVSGKGVFRDNPLTILTDDDLVITAYFTPKTGRTHRVEAAIEPDGAGKISGGGINCPDTCVIQVEDGNHITVQAYPNLGFVFSRWKFLPVAPGDVISDETENPITLLIDGEERMVAVFESVLPGKTLQTGVLPANSGHILGKGINCPPDCTEVYQEGEIVEVEAVAAAGYEFLRWEKDAVSQDPGISLVMDKNRTIQAVFDKKDMPGTDLCPDDPEKTAPGACGCGVPDVDTDGDGTPDCNDGCPDDPAKTAPGACGCGVEDADTDGDTTPDCNDGCPDDPAKKAPGACGCGVADTDTDGDATPDCNDGCPADPAKTAPGACGCGVEDTDTDGDATPDCNDGCPADPEKTAPGACGCGVPETGDTDRDGVADCNDNCPLDPAKTEPGVCGCGISDQDADGDGRADCLTNAPPLPPLQTFPDDMAITEPGMITLRAGEYEDPEGDSHNETYWVIRSKHQGQCPLNGEDAVLSENLYSYSFLAEPGIAYVWKVGFRDTGSGRITWSQWRTFISGEDLEKKTYTFPTGLDVSDYRMVTIPMWVQNPGANAVFSFAFYKPEQVVYNNTDFRVGRYEPGLDINGGYRVVSGSMVVAPGQAFWVLARNPGTFAVEGVRVSSQDSFQISLSYEKNNGWNMIGSPNHAAYDWENIRVFIRNPDCSTTKPVTVSAQDMDSLYVDTRLWRWEDGEYRSDTRRILPYEGYWVRALQENVVLEFPEGGDEITASNTVEKPLKSVYRWVGRGGIVKDAHAEEYAGFMEEVHPPMPMNTFSDGNLLFPDDPAGGCFIREAMEKETGKTRGNNLK